MSPSAKVDDRGHVVRSQVPIRVNQAIKCLRRPLEFFLEGLQLFFDIARGNAWLSADFDFATFKARLSAERAHKVGFRDG